MKSNVIEFAALPADRLVRIRNRVTRMCGILQSIDADELFAAVPDCPVEQVAQRQALTLLNRLEFELLGLVGELRDPEGLAG
jgi:hypothetical protein